MDKIFIFSIVIVIGDELHCLSGIKNYILGKVVACSVSGKDKENKKRSHQAKFRYSSSRYRTMFTVLDLYHASFIDRIKKKENTSHISVSIMDTLTYIKAFARVQHRLCHIYSQAQYINRTLKQLVQLTLSCTDSWIYQDLMVYIILESAYHINKSISQKIHNE